MEVTQRFSRQFGFLLAGVLALLAIWGLVFNDGMVWPWLLASFLLLALAWLVPNTLRPLAVAWMWLGHGLGYVNTQLLLGLVFFLIITPLALLFRLLGRDALALKQKQARSYWLRQEKSWSADSFKNQF